MNADTVSISPEQIVGTCARKKAEGYRFVTMTCTASDDDKLELLYHFDKGFKLEHLRLKISAATLLPSITGVYFAAFLVENEIQDLFGLHFTGLALDYKRKLLKAFSCRSGKFAKRSWIFRRKPPATASSYRSM